MAAPIPIDWGGLALFVGSITALLTFIGGFVMQVMVFIRQGKMDRRQTKMAETLITTHDLVNGLAERKDAAIKEAAEAKGKAIGKAEGETAAAAATEIAKSAIAKIPAAEIVVKPAKK